VINYKFSLSPPAPPKSPAEPKLIEYSYNEFWLDLPEHWKQYPSPDKNTLNWHSDVEGAAIIVSVQYYATPKEKWQELAEVMVKSRLDAHEEQYPGRIEVLHRSIKPHSGGEGLEVSYAAEAAGDTVFIFLGYVTSKKLLNLQMVCKPDRHEAARLFNNTMRKFSAKLP
jgi:hypothetical protein